MSPQPKTGAPLSSEDVVLLVAGDEAIKAACIAWHEARGSNPFNVLYHGAWCGSFPHQTGPERWTFTVPAMRAAVSAAVSAALRLPDHISSAGEKVEDEAGPAEKEVGRAVYERIEKLIKTDPNGAERGYLSHLVESVEEVGGYDGPLTPLSPANGEVAAAVEGAIALLTKRCAEIDSHYARYPASVDRSAEQTAAAIRTILTALRAQPNGGAK